jgi:site-specific recombinase XerD
MPKKKSWMELAREDYLFARQVDGLSPKTLELYSHVTKLLVDFVGEEELSTKLMRRFFANLADTRNKTTIFIYYRTIKTFIRFLLREGYITDNPLTNIKVAKPKDKFPFILSEKEVGLLLKAAKQSRSGIRNYCIVIFLIDTGVRVSELAGLTLDDIDLNSRCAKVTGKGNKDRLVFFNPHVARAISAYIDVRRAPVYENAFLVGIRDLPLTACGIQQMIRRLARKAGLDGKRVSPHTLRHCFGTYFLKESGDPFTLQELLGHSTMSTTRLYINMSKRDFSDLHLKASPAARVLRESR